MLLKASILFSNNKEFNNLNDISKTNTIYFTRHHSLKGTRHVEEQVPKCEQQTEYNAGKEQSSKKLSSTKMLTSEILPIKYVVDLFSDVRAESQEFTINSVQRCFQKIPFSWIFRVK